MHSMSAGWPILERESPFTLAIRILLSSSSQSLPTIPSPGGSGFSATYGDLKLNPVWDSLRGDPRFEKIVASLAPKMTVKLNQAVRRERSRRCGAYDESTWEIDR